MKISFPIGSVLITTLTLAALTALPVAAQEDAPVCGADGWAQVVAAGLQPEAVVQARGGGSIGGVDSQGTCTADCDNGTTVTCWGTSCSAHDSNCSTGFDGYCTGTTTGRRNCPVCPGCSATAQCAGGPPVSCTGNNSCFGLDDCYAFCDGVHHYCDPLPPFFCPEMN